MIVSLNILLIKTLINKFKFVIFFNASSYVNLLRYLHIIFNNNFINKISEKSIYKLCIILFKFCFDIRDGSSEIIKR